MDVNNLEFSGACDMTSSLPQSVKKKITESIFLKSNCLEDQEKCKIRMLKMFPCKI